MLRDPSHVRSPSLPELRQLFLRSGLPQPRTTLYELPVGLDELLSRAFPRAADLAEIRAIFTAAASDDRLGIPVRRERDEIRISFRAAILVAECPAANG